MGKDCVALTQELCTEHQYPGCEDIVHIHCAVFDGERDKWVCKKCNPLPPLKVPMPLVEKAKARKSSFSSKKLTGPLTDATMDDVVVTETAVNMIAVLQKSQGTRLKEITGIAVSDLSVDEL